MEKYDLVVIGSGPGGQRAAIQAAKLKKKVAIVEGQRLGGSCLLVGTIPSKALREAALSLSKTDPDALKKAHITTQRVIEGDAAVIRSQLSRNNIEIYEGWARFVDQYHIMVSEILEIQADAFVIATGNRPRQPSGIEMKPPFYDSDTILKLEHKPKNLAVMGGGVIGCEYASIFSALGVSVSLYDRRHGLLRGLDPEILEALKGSFTRAGISLRLGEETNVSMSNGKALIKTKADQQEFDAVLYCQGRIANVDALNLEAVGIELNESGVIPVNASYQTCISHIYAVGDVQGAPGLATSAAEQGRMAAAHIFGHFTGEFPKTFPYGVYTIPEISSIGRNEDQLREEKVDYVVGRARYKELARGKILGDEDGLLKILVDQKSRRLLGVHVIGTQATELIHIGQVAMALQADLNFFVGNVFNYPTLAEAYKVAAFQAFNAISSQQNT